MYFAINVSPYNEDIFYAHRQTASGPFGTPVELVELSTSWYERPNWLSSDELSICFASSRPSPLGSAFHIYVSTRSADTQPFGLPVMVGGINTEYGEAEASYDEARGLLYFVSDRPGGAGSTEIWVASAAVEVIPEPATLALVGAGLLALARRRGRK
jgi:hypothetical protein